MRRKSVIRFVCLALSTVLIGCVLRSDVGKPTDQEITQMQAWAEVVTPKDREQVTREANQHTDWAERRKVQFITGEYKKRYNHLQTHPTTTHSTPPSPADAASPGGL